MQHFLLVLSVVPTRKNLEIKELWVCWNSTCPGPKWRGLAGDCESFTLPDLQNMSNVTVSYTADGTGNDRMYCRSSDSRVLYCSYVHFTVI